MHNIIVIGFVGQRASGKDVSSKYIKENYEVEEIVLSDFIRQVLNVFFLPANRETFPWLSTRVREKFGDAYLADAIINKIDESDKKIFLLNGIRKIKEVEVLRDKYGSCFHLVAIRTDDRVRWERTKTREEGSEEKKDELKSSLEEFLKEEANIVTEVEINSIEKMSDELIENNGSESELRTKLDNLMKKLKINKK